MATSLDSDVPVINPANANILLLNQPFKPPRCIKASFYIPENRKFSYN